MNAVERELADLVRGEADLVRPPDGARERGWARLQAALAGGEGGSDDDGGAGTGGPTVAPAPAAPTTIAKGWPLLKVVPLVALVVAGALVGWEVGRAPEVVADRVSIATEPTSSHGPPISVPFVPVVAPAVPPPAEPGVAAPLAAPRAAVKPKPASAEPVEDFEGELQLLAAGQAAIQRGELAEGLALLRSHAQRFPRGHFAQERDALIAIGRCEVGQAGAAGAGRKFVARNPDSIHADRVRTACKL